jgi:DNA polymerase-4
MDCFYASVEMREQPELKGKPVIVGGDGTRGVVCAASYEARRYGVRSAMAGVTAKKICPKGIFLPVRMKLYAEVSKHIHDIFKRYTSAIQPIALDEAFLDVTQNHLNLLYATEVARAIKNNIANELNLVASAGVAPNRFLAKIASDLDKPNGLTVIPPHKVKTFVEELSVRKIWGVGPKLSERLSDLGIKTAGDLQAYPKSFLEKKFGKMGAQLHQLCRGIDLSVVRSKGRSKSIGRERTFREDVAEPQALQDAIEPLIRSVVERCRQKHLRPKSVTLKLKTSDFQLITRSASLQDEPITERILQKALLPLLQQGADGKQTFRLIGVSAHRLVDMEPEHDPNPPFHWIDPSMNDALT